MSGKRKLAMLGTVMLAGLALGACTSNGQDLGVNDGGITDGSSSSGGPPNDGTGPTTINQGGTPSKPGTPVTGHFVCTGGAKTYGNVTTAVGGGGLLGGPLTDLLNLLGGSTLTTLLNSVTEPNNVIDGNLSTFSTFSLTLGLLGGLLDTVDESVLLPSGTTVPAGKFAVFGVSFPKGTVDLSLVNKVQVATYLTDNKGVSNLQEGLILDQSALTLLGAIGGSTPAAVWIGVETTVPYDRATISLTPGLLTASVGDAMHVFELCVDGRLQ
jgi:hypothetical protein